jgi:hypothetical protein
MPRRRHLPSQVVRLVVVHGWGLSGESRRTEPPGGRGRSPAGPISGLSAGVGAGARGKCPGRSRARADGRISPACVRETRPNSPHVFEQRPAAVHAQHQPVAALASDVAAADHGTLRGPAAAAAGPDFRTPGQATRFSVAVWPPGRYKAGVNPSGVTGLARRSAPWAVKRRPSVLSVVHREGSCFRPADRPIRGLPNGGLARPRGARSRRSVIPELVGGPESPPRPGPGSRQHPEGSGPPGDMAGWPVFVSSAHARSAGGGTVTGPAVERQDALSDQALQQPGQGRPQVAVAQLPAAPPGLDVPARRRGAAGPTAGRRSSDPRPATVRRRSDKPRSMCLRQARLGKEDGL